jgi:hypothetical protein
MHIVSRSSYHPESSSQLRDSHHALLHLLISFLSNTFPRFALPPRDTPLFCHLLQISSFSHLTMPGVDSEPLGDNISLFNGFAALRSSPGPNCCGGFLSMVLYSTANSTGPSPWGLESCSYGRLEHRQHLLLKLCPNLRYCCLLCLRLLPVHVRCDEAVDIMFSSLL